MKLPAGWQPWCRTILRFGTGELEVDVAKPADGTVIVALRALGLQGPFVVITPCNPRGLLIDPRENARRVDTAAVLLAGHGLTAVPVVGQSPDGSHREAGWAVALPRTQAVALAREWEQEGLYWWDGARFWIVSVEGDWPDIPLPIPESGSRSE